MPIHNTPTDRRAVLRAIGATAVGASIAGCTSLGALGGDDGEGHEDAILGPPENYDRGSEIELPYPRYGDALPEATMPAPLQDRTISTREFVGDRHVVMTFIYTSCQTVCPGLTAALRRVQADSIAEGYADQVALLPTTFDPAYDTEPVLEDYGDTMGVDDTAGNWFFLRPESPERAREVVEGTFGVAFERQEDDGDTDGDSDGGTSGDDGSDADGGNESDGEGGSDTTTNGEDDDGTDDGDMEDGDHGGHHRMFVHSSLILIANADGVVERAYTGGPPQAGTLSDNLRTIVEAW